MQNGDLLRREKKPAYWEICRYPSGSLCVCSSCRNCYVPTKDAITGKWETCPHCGEKIRWRNS